jgi:hypothetical protein
MHAVEPAVWSQARPLESHLKTQRRSSSASGFIIAASVVIGGAGAALIVWVLVTEPESAPTPPTAPRTPAKALSLGVPSIQRSASAGPSASAPPSTSASAKPKR